MGGYPPVGILFVPPRMHFPAESSMACKRVMALSLLGLAFCYPASTIGTPGPSVSVLDCVLPLMTLVANPPNLPV